MKLHICCLLYFCLFSSVVLGAQKAKIIGPSVEVYTAADFDSDVLAYVKSGETYLISNKNTGPFYRIKLKNGKIGYVVDYELEIEGKGRPKERDFDELLATESLNLNDSERESEYEKEEEASLFGNEYAGYSIQVINYHENTMGADQVANIVGVGYKSISILAWSILANFGAPDYYKKTGGSATGMQLWADMGFSNTLAYLQSHEIRFSGGLFSHFSVLQVKTPVRNYDLHDVTVGLELETSFLLKLKQSAFDFGVKYYFDKSNYAGFVISYLY